MSGPEHVSSHDYRSEEEAKLTLTNALSSGLQRAFAGFDLMTHAGPMATYHYRVHWQCGMSHTFTVPVKYIKQHGWDHSSIIEQISALAIFTNVQIPPDPAIDRAKLQAAQDKQAAMQQQKQQPDLNNPFLGMDEVLQQQYRNAMVNGQSAVKVTAMEEMASCVSPTEREQQVLRAKSDAQKLYEKMVAEKYPPMSSPPPTPVAELDAPYDDEPSLPEGQHLPIGRRIAKHLLGRK